MTAAAYSYTPVTDPNLTSPHLASHILQATVHYIRYGSSSTFIPTPSASGRHPLAQSSDRQYKDQTEHDVPFMNFMKCPLVTSVSVCS